MERIDWYPIEIVATGLYGFGPDPATANALMEAAMDVSEHDRERAAPMPAAPNTVLPERRSVAFLHGGIALLAAIVGLRLASR